MVHPVFAYLQKFPFFRIRFETIFIAGLQDYTQGIRMKNAAG